MKITTFSDYTLRVLIYLATHKGEKCTTDQIAKAYEISFHHVAKAAQWLVREDYITAERGRSGGIFLARAPKDINLGDLVLATEAGTALVDCMKANGGTCCISPACGLKLILAEAKAAFFETLNRFTLADVMKQKSALGAILISTD